MDPRLDFARQLEVRDAEVGERLAVLRRLSEEIDRIRERAAEVASLRERLPLERERVTAAVAEAEAGLRATRDAQATVAAPGQDPAEVERRLVEARTAVAAAQEVVNRTARRQAALEEAAAEAEARAAELAAAAAAAAQELQAAPRIRLAAAPGGGLNDVLDWAARAHAALLVARSGLESERDRIFREANELGSSILGEPLQSTNVALVRRRVEERLGRT